MRRYLVSATLLMTTLSAAGQWKIQDAHTTASLRGIHSLGKGVAWASGTDGTVLRTKDGGATWEHCATPPNAEKLDFRGVQGFDAKTAIVMSSGKGDLSRLYKTTDGCQTWKLLRTSTQPDGFWDALVFANRIRGRKEPDSGELIGDPVKGRFEVFSLMGPDWTEEHNNQFAPTAQPHEAAFAASNSSVLSFGRRNFMLGTGGVHGSRVIFFRIEPDPPGSDMLEHFQQSANVPIASGTDSAGIFSLGIKERGVIEDLGYYFETKNPDVIVAVGGDYLQPNNSAGTAAYSSDGGAHWAPAKTPPNGYRSSVWYDSNSKTWVTVGTNGTDISTDDGASWHALKPGPNDASDADKNWNALSLPFVVGPHGRIGVLRPDALKASK